MHELRIQVGPVAFRIGSVWKKPINQLTALYADYPRADFVDFTVRLEPTNPVRRFIRPSIALRGDYMLPGVGPFPLTHGVLAAETGMDLQMALGWRRQLILHAAALERDGRVMIIAGAQGVGKSTLSAMLGQNGSGVDGRRGPWRFMGDEFTLIDVETGDAVPFPRLIGLKNEMISTMETWVDERRLGPLLSEMPQGSIRHLVPPKSAIDAMGERAKPALLIFPRFGHEPAIRELGAADVFVRLTQGSTNYVALGQTGFDSLVRLVRDVPARTVDYRNGEEAKLLIEQLWTEIS